MAIAEENKTRATFLKRHPVAAFFVLAFLISWGGVLMITLRSGIPGRGSALETLLMPVYLTMLAGPFVSALFMSIALNGRTGLVYLFRGFTLWRAKPYEYAIAFLLIPACASTALLGLSLVSPDFKPGFLVNPSGFPSIMTGIAAGLASGFVVAMIEETGWTGFAAPRLISTHGVLSVGLGFGILHGFWHFLVTVWQAGAEYELVIIPFLVTLWLLALIVMRMLIIWIFARTKSTLLAAITHASHTGCLFAIWPPGTSPVQDVIWTSAFAALGLVAAFAVLFFTPAVGNS